MARLRPLDRRPRRWSARTARPRDRPAAGGRARPRPPSRRQWSETVPAGVVISADPAAGEAIRGTDVQLVVSKGPERFVVPADLVGQDGRRRRRRSCRTRCRSRSPPTSSYDDDVAAGLVIGFDPPAGTDAASATRSSPCSSARATSRSPSPTSSGQTPEAGDSEPRAARLHRQAGRRRPQRRRRQGRGHGRRPRPGRRPGALRQHGDDPGLGRRAAGQGARRRPARTTPRRSRSSRRLGLRSRRPSSSATRSSARRPKAGETVEQGTTVKILAELLARHAPPCTEPVPPDRRARPDQGRPGQGRPRRTPTPSAPAAVQVFVGNPRGWKLDRRRPRAGRAVHRRLRRARASRRSSTRRSWSTSAPPPRRPSSSRSPPSRTTCARGAQLGCAGRRRARRLGRRRGPLRGARCASCTSGCCRCSTPLPADGPRLLIEPTAGGGKALAATVQDLGPYFAALEDHPLRRRLLRHLPRLGGRPRPVGAGRDDGDARRAGGHRRPRPARAGARQRLARRVRLQARPAHDDRRGLDRASTPFAELLAHPSMAGVPVVVETPSELDGSPSAGHTRDIALLCSLRDAPRPHRRLTQDQNALMDTDPASSQP